MTLSVTGVVNLDPALAPTLAQMLHEDIGFDADAAPMDCRANCSGPSYSPSHGPGVPTQVHGGHDGGRPRFATDLAELAQAQTQGPRVGTPPSEATHDPNFSFPVSADEALRLPLASKSRRAAV